MGVRVRMGVSIREIGVRDFFDQEKDPYADDNKQVCLHCFLAVLMPTMSMVVSVVVSMIVRIPCSLSLTMIMTSFTQVRKSMEEDISKETTKGK